MGQIGITAVTLSGFESLALWLMNLRHTLVFEPHYEEDIVRSASRYDSWSPRSLSIIQPVDIMADPASA